MLEKVLHINDTFNKELPADPIKEHTRRQVKNACFSYVQPKKTSQAKLISVAPEVAEMLGLQEKDYSKPQFLNVFSGNAVLANTEPYAMCYGGHQFGHWAGQLGDGRAINLAEIVHNKKRWALQLKGAGPTPYSRRADGLAVLRSSVREYLCSEAMFHLDIPTTRALSLSLTGDQVLRDILYNGNAAYEKGAVVCRVAPSFIRFGNFEIFAANQDINTLKVLTDYTIRHFYPELGTPSKETYLRFFTEVSERTLEMIIHWQRVGFVHGVMNTDNFSILGLTIDYGPYGWLEGYEPNWTPNTTDRENRRYRFGNQPNIALWNLLKLANALFPLIQDAAPLEAILQKFQKDYPIKYQEMMAKKIGLNKSLPEDGKLIAQLEDNLQLIETDMTIFFRNLAQFKTQKNANHINFESITTAFYKASLFQENIKKTWQDWLVQYNQRLLAEKSQDQTRQLQMNQVNPKYVLRNYMAQLAIDAADKGDYALIETFLNLLKHPYKEQIEMEKWFAKRPEWARHKVGCSMLSCSS